MRNPVDYLWGVLLVAWLFGDVLLFAAGVLAALALVSLFL